MGYGSEVFAVMADSQATSARLAQLIADGKPQQPKLYKQVGRGVMRWLFDCSVVSLLG